VVVKALLKHLSQAGFDLQKAMRDREIELISVAGKSHIHFAPRWQDTWQASTALLLIQVILADKRKQGKHLPKLGLSHPVSE
jgi:hypothetical protein